MKELHIAVREYLNLWDALNERSRKSEAPTIEDTALAMDEKAQELRALCDEIEGCT